VVGDRRARVAGEAGAAVALADLGQHAVQMRRRLGVDRDAVRAGVDELLDLALGPLDHEVAVEEDVVGEGVAQGGDHERPERDRRDEVPVHDVDVDHAGARVDDEADLVAELREIGREDRGGDADLAHIGCNIEESQWTQRMIAVLDMRTIVECSPHCGHTETSSKRCRQFTQRYRPGRFVGRSHGSPQAGQVGPRSIPPSCRIRASALQS
jgi:hypothetical protein